MGRRLPAWSIVVTAEHGGNEVPIDFADIFRNAGPLLASHRGWDPGTFDLAKELAGRLDAAIVTSSVTRLLVDLNRSPHNPRVFSELTRSLPRLDRDRILTQYHRPHRDRIADLVSRTIRAGGRVLHVGVHSFTPTLDGVTRTPDLAVLYDPRRSNERAFAGRWVKVLAAAVPGHAVRRNDPYRGNSDGLTTTLRGGTRDTDYLGLEIEVNQRHLGSDGRFPTWVSSSLVDTLRDVLRAEASPR